MQEWQQRTITRPDVSLIGTPRQIEVTGFNRDARRDARSHGVNVFTTNVVSTATPVGGYVYTITVGGEVKANGGLSFSIGDVVTQSIITDIETAVSAAYASGYNDGYDAGYADGYADGFTDGVNSVQ